MIVMYLYNLISNSLIDDSFFHQFFDHEKQWNFGIELLKQMGYSFDSGRQDISAHPFSSSFSPQDARVTTRIDKIIWEHKFKIRFKNQIHFFRKFVFF